MLDTLRVGDVLVETDSYDTNVVLLLDVESVGYANIWRVLCHTEQKTYIGHFSAATLYGNFQHIGHGR